MSGFFEPEDVTRFASARDEAHRLLNCAPNQHVTLVDITRMDIQRQEMVGQFAMLLSRPETASRKLAFVVPASLARMQIKRAAAGRGAAFFVDDRSGAERWLLDELPSVNVA